MLNAVRVAALVALSLAVSSAAQAQTYSDSVRKHCRSDYMTHCSEHPVGSKSLRACMRKVGRDLKPACINALAESGEIGAKDRRQRRADGR